MNSVYLMVIGLSRLSYFLFSEFLIVCGFQIIEPFLLSFWIHEHCEIITVTQAVLLTCLHHSLSISKFILYSLESSLEDLSTS